MEQSLKDLCEPHLWAIAIVLLVLLLLGPLLYGAGVLLKPLIGKAINAGLKRLSGESVEVNINPGITGGPMPGPNSPIACDECGFYKKCLMHERRVSESKANKEAIAKVDKRIDTLWTAHEQLQRDMISGFDHLRDKIGDSQGILLTAIKEIGK